MVHSMDAWWKHFFYYVLDRFFFFIVCTDEYFLQYFLMFFDAFCRTTYNINELRNSVVHKWINGYKVNISIRSRRWAWLALDTNWSHKIFSVGLSSDILHGRKLRAVSSPFSTWKCCALVARGHLQTLSTSSVNVQSFVARIVVYALFQIVQIHSMAASFVQSVRKSRTIWDVRAL